MPKEPPGWPGAGSEGGQGAIVSVKMPSSQREMATDSYQKWSRSGGHVVRDFA